MSRDNVKKSVSQFDKSLHEQALTRLSRVNACKDELSSDKFKVIKEYLLKHNGPTMRHNKMINALCIGRSTSFLLIKNDPTFPKGFPIYDSVNSPKVYLTLDVIAWLEARYQQFCNQQEGN